MGIHGVVFGLIDVEESYIRSSGQKSFDDGRSNMARPSRHHDMSSF